MDVEFNGTFFVNKKDDNDYAGFVFNYQSNKRFIVVSWKKSNETYAIRAPFVSTAMSGIQIKVLLKIIGPKLYTIIILLIYPTGGRFKNWTWGHTEKCIVEYRGHQE